MDTHIQMNLKREVYDNFAGDNVRLEGGLESYVGDFP